MPVMPSVSLTSSGLLLKYAGLSATYCTVYVDAPPAALHVIFADVEPVAETAGLAGVAGRDWPETLLVQAESPFVALAVTEQNALNHHVSPLVTVNVYEPFFGQDLSASFFLTTYFQLPAESLPLRTDASTVASLQSSSSHSTSTVAVESSILTSMVGVGSLSLRKSCSL